MSVVQFGHNYKGSDFFRQAEAKAAKSSGFLTETKVFATGAPLRGFVSNNDESLKYPVVWLLFVLLESDNAKVLCNDYSPISIVLIHPDFIPFFRFILNK